MRFKRKRHFLLILMFYLFLVACKSSKKNVLTLSASIVPAELKSEYYENPLGIDVVNPRLEWKLKPVKPGARGLIQTAYQVLVASSPQLLQQDKGDLWNSGKIDSRESNAINYAGNALDSHQKVWWKVRVWDQEGKPSAWSPVQDWTMGVLMLEDWSGARWIGAPEKLTEEVNSTFLLRRDFNVKPGLKRVVVSVTGLGQYDIILNGRQPTKSILNPGWTQYDKTVLYDTYDVTDLINEGPNAVGMLISNGMYKVKKGGRYAKLENSFGPLQAIAKVLLEYEDGSTDVVITDDSWRAGESPMTYSSIFGGEDWDARKVQNDWDKAGFDASGWLPVESLDGPGGELKGITHAAPPIRKFQVTQPISSNKLNATTTIYDLGQDASYVFRFTVSGPAGSVVKITPSELLNEDGTIFRNGYNGKSYIVYTLAGTGKEEYTTKYYTTSCRYLKVECLPAPGGEELPALESIAGVVVHSDSPFVGEFTSSNELFNDIFEMIRWAEVSNMKSVISDNPHRERLGWLEQTHLHGPSFRYNYDMRPLVDKIMHDMNDTQLENGLVPCISPELTVFGADWREAIEWGTASIMLPWQQYMWSGDLEVLHRNYSMMKDYLGYLKGKAKDGIYAAEGKGDWAGRRTSPHTPKELVGTAFYFKNADVLAKTARLLGKTAEAEQFEKLANNIRSAFNDKFFNPETSQYGTGSQAADAMALALGIAEVKNEPAVLKNLITDIENRDYENTTGEVGIRYLFEALAERGRSDVTYSMMNQNEKPGYAYQLKMGATAIPETWDAGRDNSQNQFMLGHIMQWFYQHLAGIQLDTSNPGFTHFIIKPQIVGDLIEIKGSYNSVQGKIVSEWKRTVDKINMHVVVPPNTTATVYIPAKDIGFITENEISIEQAEGVESRGMDNAYAVVQLGSGDYTFESTLP